MLFVCPKMGDPLGSPQPMQHDLHGLQVVESLASELSQVDQCPGKFPRFFWWIRGNFSKNRGSAHHFPAFSGSFLLEFLGGFIWIYALKISRSWKAYKFFPENTGI